MCIAKKSKREDKRHTVFFSVDLEALGLVKGKPWDLEDEKKLIDWYRSGVVSFRVLSFNFEFKYSENAIYQKLLDLGILKEEEANAKKTTSSSSTLTVKLAMPKELPSIEETLKTLSAALKSLDTPGLEKNDVFRLHCIIAGAKVYKELYRITWIIVG